MILKKLSQWPSSKTLKILLILGLIFCFSVIPVMQYFSNLSGYPADLFTSQLSFSGDLMRGYYALTNIEIYRISPSLDYIFMLGYGLIAFSLSLLIARRYDDTSKIHRVGILVAIFGITAACCDAIENIFILTMLTNPGGFPNYLAISHSVFALIKWILLFGVITWDLTMGIFALMKRKK
jgi:hypothetical protein